MLTDIEDPNLAAMKREFAAIRQMFEQPNRRLFVMRDGMHPSQIGLWPVMVDERGRLWRVHGSTLERIDAR